MDINLLETFLEAPLPVQLVVIVLTLQALGSLIVTIDRVIMLLRAGGASREFARKATPLMQRGDWRGLNEEAKKATGSHLAHLMGAALTTFVDRKDAGDDDERAAELARRSVERRGETLSNTLNRGLNILASTGSTAPFVGLLGTVLGILFAFKQIEATGAGGIATIGGAIGEALIVTGYGLVVAIPTVLLYNWLSGWIAKYETGLTNAASELTDLMEVGVAPGMAASVLDPPEGGEVADEAAEPAAAGA
ncbi:MAG: MotA/TolQ/ExbB proton channel family protein [Sandaracinaceae bacterium]